MKIAKGAKGHREVFTYSEGGVPRSMVELIVMPDLFGKRPVGYIHKVYTDETHKGRGLATSLVRKAVDFAREKGCYKVFLTCREETAPFYEKSGFKKEQVGMVLRFD